MTSESIEQMAEGIVRLRAEILRRRSRAGGIGAADLTSPQALALRAVVAEEPLRMSALADRLGVSVATASRTVDALAGQELVRRERDPDDARAVRVCATTRGRREQRTRRRRFARALEVLLNELSEDERHQLAQSLETLNRLLGPVRRD